MAWKQDLAKLKQQLPPEEPAPAAKPLPKPVPRPGGPAPLAEEDEVFLSAMGLKPTSPKNPKPSAADTHAAAAEGSMPATEAPAPATAPLPETFQAAIKDLKGLKPLSQGILGGTTAAPKASLAPTKVEPIIPEGRSEVSPETHLIPAVPSVPSKAVLPVEPGPAPNLPPMRFQLAAGMAIEVDGSLDLRGHSLVDALDRLKDRLGDGLVLGWRSLQVNLGTDPALHEGLLALLASGQLPMVGRFAQAPVPMGGTQAWLLYFGPAPTQPSTTPRREP